MKKVYLDLPIKELPVSPNDPILSDNNKIVFKGVRIYTRNTSVYVDEGIDYYEVEFYVSQKPAKYHELSSKAYNYLENNNPQCFFYISITVHLTDEYLERFAEQFGRYSSTTKDYLITATTSSHEMLRHLKNKFPGFRFL